MFVEDPDFEAQLRRSAGLNRVLADRADQVAGLAKALVAYDSGHFSRSIETDLPEPGTARVLSTDGFFHLIEFGGPRSRTQAPLRRAAEVLCDGFDIEAKS